MRDRHNGRGKFKTKSERERGNMEENTDENMIYIREKEGGYYRESFRATSGLLFRILRQRAKERERDTHTKERERDRHTRRRERERGRNQVHIIM